MKNATRRRGPTPAPFAITLGKMIENLRLPLDVVAELLHVPDETLQAWLSDAASAPHRLMQIGAVAVLGAKIAYMRKGQAARKWIITTPDKKTHETPELVEWLRQRYPGEKAESVAATLGQRGRHVRLGLVAERKVYRHG